MGEKWYLRHCQTGLVQLSYLLYYKIFYRLGNKVHRKPPHAQHSSIVWLCTLLQIIKYIVICNILVDKTIRLARSIRKRHNCHFFLIRLYKHYARQIQIDFIEIQTLQKFCLGSYRSMQLLQYWAWVFKIKRYFLNKQGVCLL